MISDLNDREAVESLVDQFYQQARTDELLGPVFLGALGSGDWSGHLRVVSDFWCTILLGERSYPGGFMWKHLRLPLRAEHAERWATLFTALVKDTHAGPFADEALRRVEIMKAVLIAKLAHRDGGSTVIQ